MRRARKSAGLDVTETACKPLANRPERVNSEELGRLTREWARGGDSQFSRTLPDAHVQTQA